MEAFEDAPVEYTSDGEISEQMSATVTNSLRKLGKRKINILLMGRGSSGKTSMRSIIFDCYKPIETRKLCPTDQVEMTHVLFFKNILLNIKDCGGQDIYLRKYFGNKRNNMFHNINIFIHVFNMENENDELAKDLNFYQTCLSAVCEHSPSVEVFCLIHKSDLVAKDQRKKMFEDRQNCLINISNPVNITCFMSSIWDESLYRAWSLIINRLNVQKPEETIEKLINLMKCNKPKQNIPNLIWYLVFKVNSY